MEEGVAIRELLARFRRGEPAAAEEVSRRFGPIIRAAARRQLNSQLRTWYDSVDFVQDVWAAVLAAPPEGHTFPTAEALGAFLCRVAHDKVIDAVRCRSKSRMGDGTGAPAEGGRGPAALEERPSPDPSPEQLAIAADRWAQILSFIPPGHRAVVERLREGYSRDDIARMAGVSPSTIKRIVRRIRELASD